jgi:hypothetical protein
MDFTANPADLFGRPYLYATIDFTDVNGILKGIEIAETMPGVKLILTHLDYKLKNFTLSPKQEPAPIQSEPVINESVKEPVKEPVQPTNAKQI